MKAALLFVSACASWSVASLAASPVAIADRVGAVYEITRDVESAGDSNGASTSSSTDRDTLIERVLAVRNDGLELEYDLPADATKEDRASTWQFPVRVFRPFSGAPQLLNRPELENRIKLFVAIREARPHGDQTQRR